MNKTKSRVDDLAKSKTVEDDIWYGLSFHFYTLPHQLVFYKTFSKSSKKKKTLWKKGEYAGNQHFLSILQCFTVLS